MNCKNRNFGLIILLAASFIWGASNIFLRGSLQAGSFTLNTMGTILGGIILIILSFLKKEHGENKKNTLVPGMLCGIPLFIALTFCRFGINSFFCTIFVVFVPLFCFLRGKSISPQLWGAALLTFAGIYIFTHLNGLFKVNFANWLGIVATLGFAAHIILVEKYVRNVNIFRFGAVQCLTAGILSLIFMIFFEKESISLVKSSFCSVIYLGIFICCIALILQLMAQKYTEAAISSVYLSYRVFFSTIFSMIFLGQSFTGFFFSGLAVTLCGFLFYQRELFLKKDGDLIK